MQQLRYELSQVYDGREFLFFNGATWRYQQGWQEDIDTPITYDDYSGRYERPRRNFRYVSIYGDFTMSKVQMHCDK